MIDTEKMFYCGTLEIAEAIADVLNYLGIAYAIRIIDGEAEIVVYNN